MSSGLRVLSPEEGVFLAVRRDFLAFWKKTGWAPRPRGGARALLPLLLPLWLRILGSSSRFSLRRKTREAHAQQNKSARKSRWSTEVSSPMILQLVHLALHLILQLGCDRAD